MITAAEVRQAKFRSQIGGYQKAAVRDLMQRIADAIDAGESPGTLANAELPVVTRGYRLTEVQELLDRVRQLDPDDPQPAPTRPPERHSTYELFTTPSILVRPRPGVYDADGGLLAVWRQDTGGWSVVSNLNRQPLLWFRPPGDDEPEWIVADAHRNEIGRIVPKRLRRYELRAGETTVGQCKPVLGLLVPRVTDADGRRVAAVQGQEGKTVIDLNLPIGQPLHSLVLCVAINYKVLYPDRDPGSDPVSISPPVT